MALKTFTMEQTLLTLGGREVKGFGDGESVSISYPNEDWGVISGTHGEVVRAKAPNNTATMKIRLVQGNPTNGYLLGKRNDDAVDGSGSFDVVFKDLNSDTEIRADRAWVSKIPDTSWGSEPGVREWEIILVNPELTLGEITE